MNKLFGYFTTSLLYMLVGFFLGLCFVPAEVIAAANTVLTVVVIALLILTWIMKSKKKRGFPRFSMGWVYLFAFIEGILLYPTLMFYLAELGIILFFNIIIGTLLIFGILSFVGVKQKSGSFIKLSYVLFIALTILVIMSILNLLLHIGWLPIVLSAAGIIIFSLYIMVDVNKFKTAYEAGLIRDEKDYSIFVLNVYLDYINLLIDVLDFIYRLKD